jgi:putative DNA primase/helicase
MSKPNLMQLAPLQIWEANFEAKKSFNLDMAQNMLIMRSMKERVFTSKWLRGRGAWVDGKSIVLHTGSRLIVDGKYKELQQHKSKFIYEIGEDLEIETDFPLSNIEAYKFIDICKLLSWQREIDAYFLAGWCVVAPVCGALSWRPHLWLTGEAGSGKSWVFQKIVRASLGETALAVQGETTEAGVRQLLKQDARPVVFDEAEGNDKRALERVQDVLSLMRQASTSDGGAIVKGQASQSAKIYRIRSCFAFAAINEYATHQSDLSRITSVSLRKEPNSLSKSDKWKKLQESYDNTFNDEYTARLRARTIALLPVILKNAKTFSAAVASELGEQRAGDQIGTLLAGAYSLASEKEISFEEAIKWIQSKDWTEEKNNDRQKDQVALINFIMDQMTFVETAHIKQERSIGELLQITHRLISDAVITRDAAFDRLLRIGIKIDQEEYVVISNSSDGIKRMLRETPWAKNHNKILMRLETAEAVESTRFAAGTLTRAVRVKFTAIFKDLGKF